jgi:hypothetical protein
MRTTCDAATLNHSFAEREQQLAKYSTKRNNLRSNLYDERASNFNVDDDEHA